MNAALITGSSGAGKTQVAAARARRGLASADAGDDPLLSRLVDAASALAEPPEAPVFAWLATQLGKPSES